ncbi:type III secretion system export apparatus subunit SctT [Stenotrophomonas sp. B1-1]|uniref:type III secretion system export apparatus subunit SctT n=1 Tax=Stenotrophomonas sp. B1-1 TaxID=2710648 RepID=UPI0013DAFCF6|nr:type III secretion system export apparatus subunit SctT [Stenotrophomonas sp. B1-1]
MQSLDAQLILLAQDHLHSVALGLARILACFAWLPYLGSGAMPAKTLRTLVAGVVFVGLFPQIMTGEQAGHSAEGLALLVALGSEAIVGTVLGLVIAAPYHVFHAVGAMIDSQRGGSVSAMLDPLTGVEATETSNLLQMAAACVFLLGGGMQAVVEVLQGSYALVPFGSAFTINPDAAGDYVRQLLGNLVRIAGPVLILLFLVEVLLGILSRFAQQLNAFSLTLSVKSIVAFAAMLVYIFGTLAQDVPRIWHSMDPQMWLVPGATP